MQPRAVSRRGANGRATKNSRWILHEEQRLLFIKEVETPYVRVARMVQLDHLEEDCTLEGYYMCVDCTCGPDGGSEVKEIGWLGPAGV
jgi:hypothetical protein